VSDIVHLQIEKVIHGGDGLARLPAADERRQAVFVPFTLPGERVRVELGPTVRGRRQGRLLEVLEPAAGRVTPGCEYFGRCGGCQLQHASAELQLELKLAILLESLARLGGIVWNGAVAVHASPPWGYRNRIRVQSVPGIGVGYYERESRRVVPITHCPIASPALNQGLAELAAAPPARRETVELAVDNHDHGLHAAGPLEFAVNGHRYRVSSGAFFQANRFLAEPLVAAVTAGVQGASAVDLYSGVGLFALPLAGAFARVEAVEGSPAAAADLRHNAQGHPIEVVEEEALDYLRRRPLAPLDLLVADPPRAGLGPDVTAEILRHAPARLHLVSCDPATLARDLRSLAAGGYRIVELHLFDLFPQTAQIESLAWLERIQ
jgi:23S rRNA (uracil1939-C5)-methyltransferase